MTPANLFAALSPALEEMQAGLFTAQAALGRAQAAAEQLGTELGEELTGGTEELLEPIHKVARASRDLGEILAQRHGPAEPLTFADE